MILDFCQAVVCIGGLSNIDILISNRHPEEREIYGEQDRDQYFGSRTGVVAASNASSDVERVESDSSAWDCASERQ